MRYMYNNIINCRRIFFSPMLHNHDDYIASRYYIAIYLHNIIIYETRRIIVLYNIRIYLHWEPERFVTIIVINLLLYTSDRCRSGT